jgi:uncharacterized protein (UPF0335 family)
VSVQLSEYLQLRADGVRVEEAARRSTIGLAEARLHEAAIESGDLPLPRARAPAREDQPSGEGTSMAVGNIAADELRLFIERIERLDEEIKGLNDDKRDVYAEAKAQGFDAPTMRRCIKIRKLEPHTRDEAEALLATYLEALGINAEIPLALVA